MLLYTKYDDLDINEELKKIKESEEVQIKVDPNNKKCLFFLGMLFANGVKIDILNEGELRIDGEGKSFSKMAFVWNRLGLKNFTNDRFKLGEKIVEARNNGISVEKINNNPIDKKIFLICPVRNATEEQRKWIEEFVERKTQEGYIIHAPHLHTNQVDPLGGYGICKQNSEAVASSEEIDIYYDQSSTGSVFDLGVAYALHKPIKVLNEKEIKYNEEDFVDHTIMNWPYQSKKVSIENIGVLKSILEKSWSIETCSPGLREQWTEENSSLGQCAITSLIVNDICGGKIMRCMASSGSHYYNIIDEQIVDLTVEQFLGEIPDYEHSEERTREYLLGNEDTKKRYRELLGKVRKTIIDKNFEEIDSDENINKYRNYLNRYYMFSTFEIDEYSKDEECEYTRFDLAAQNTGLIIDARHNLITDQYSCSVDGNRFPLSTEILKVIFDAARKHKDSLVLEKKLTDAYSKVEYNKQ